MSFVVISDANVLYPSTLRDVLIRLVQTGLVQAKWSETILDETFGSLHAQCPDVDEVDP